MKKLLILIIAFVALPTAHGFLQEFLGLNEPSEQQAYDMYYAVMDVIATKSTDTAITNLTQALLAEAPKNSEYIKESVVERIIFEGDMQAVSIVLAEKRRKEEEDRTQAAYKEYARTTNEAREAVDIAAEVNEFRADMRAANPDSPQKLEEPRNPGKAAATREWSQIHANKQTLSLFTVKELQDGYEQILSMYQTEQELADLQADLTVEHQFSIMYENGTLDDSFYDLIVDVNELDKIWFGDKSETITAPWEQPMGPAKEFVDQRDLAAEPGSFNPETLKLNQDQSRVFVPRTNKEIMLPYENTTASAEDNSQPNDYFFTPMVDRTVMLPQLDPVTSPVDIPTEFQFFCEEDSYFCIKIFIEVSTYELLGDGDSSVRAQIEKAKNQLEDMSQKNLMLRTVGKNIFEPAAFGASFPKALSMNVHMASKATIKEYPFKDPKRLSEEMERAVQEAFEACRVEDFAQESQLANPPDTYDLANRTVQEIREAKNNTCDTALDALEDVARSFASGENQDMASNQIQVLSANIENMIEQFRVVLTQGTAINNKPTK